MTDQNTKDTPGVDGAKETAREAKDAAHERGQALKDEARQGLESARSRVESEAERGKDHVGQSVGDTADALETAAGSAREGSIQQQLLSEAANGLSGIASEMEGKSLSEIVGGVSNFARRNPGAFLGGMALAGFAMSRFARASERARDEDGRTSGKGGRAPVAGQSAAGRLAAPVVQRPNEGQI